VNNARKTHNILSENRQLGPFPTHRLKHVENPTNLLTDKIQRIDSREIAFARGARGDYGLAVQREAGRTTSKSPLAATMRDTLRYLSHFKCSQVVAQEAPVPNNPIVLSRHIKRLGYFLKADIMGICEVPEYAVYSHDRLGNPININYKYAIVIVARKEYETMYASTGYDWSGVVISTQAYQHLGIVAHTIAEYIRRLGYPAQAQHAFQDPVGYNVAIPPLLLWAGIGEVSRAGIILNPFLGLAYKAAAVLTDLPLVPDKPIDFGLQDFCQNCKICAKECPSKAIPMGDKVLWNGYETWKINDKQCASFNILNKTGTICNKCVKVCPWTRPDAWQHNLVRWGVTHSSIARRLAVKADNIWQDHRKAHMKNKWWFD